MNKTFGLLFYVKRSKMIGNGTVPVYLRITVDGERIEILSRPGFTCRLQREIGNIGKALSPIKTY